jgi:DNA polymerase III epsilon subunit-like protein
MMWRVLLDLLHAARRPLIFVDFETAGLGGKPPVEYAALVYAPWEAQADDAETRRAAAVCPPGLSFAVRQRVDPGVPIDPGATRVHGIKDADVRGLPRWDSPEIRGWFQACAIGTPEEVACAIENEDCEGPAIWCGHNIAGADAPWARKWGHLPNEDLDLIDTMRLCRRLQRDMPHPLALDDLTAFRLTLPGGPAWAEDSTWCADVGLDAFASSLVGFHAAMTGARHEAHGAMADCEATTRAFCRALEAWSPLWPPRRQDLPATANLSALLAALDAPPQGQVSWDGWLTEVDSPAPPKATRAGQQALPPTGPVYEWAKGKFKGQPAHRDTYVLDLPRRPTGDDAKSWWCSQHTADILAGLRPMAVSR